MIKRRNALKFKYNYKIMVLNYNYNNIIWREIIKSSNFDQVINEGFNLKNGKTIKTIKLYINI